MSIVWWYSVFTFNVGLQKLQEKVTFILVQFIHQVNSRGLILRWWRIRLTLGFQCVHVRMKQVDRMGIKGPQWATITTSSSNWSRWRWSFLVFRVWNMREGPYMLSPKLDHDIQTLNYHSTKLIWFFYQLCNQTEQWQRAQRGSLKGLMQCYNPILLLTGLEEKTHKLMRHFY